MEEAPRRTLSASTPRHPPLVRTSPPRRAKRRGGSRDARAERAPPRPPEAWRRTRRLREKALPPLQPAVPDGRAEDGTPTVRHRAAVTAAAAEPPPPPSGLAKAGGQGAAAAGDGGPRSRRHEAPTPKESDGRGKRNEPSSGDGGEDDPPPTTTRSFGRPRGGRGDRPRDARASDTVACERAGVRRESPQRQTLVSRADFQ